jgi:DNA-damage-inducible protein D
MTNIVDCRKLRYDHGVVMKNDLAIFEGYKIRRLYDEKTETWFFSVVDIVQVLIQQPDYQAARNYWKVLKNRLKKEGSESVTFCNRLKLEAADGKKYLTDVANVETLLRLIQSVVLWD